MKKLFYYLSIILMLVSCKKEKNIYPELIEKTLNFYKGQLPENIVFYRTINNKDIKDTSNYKFLSGPEILNILKEDFCELQIDKIKNKISIQIYMERTGKGLTCYYDESSLKMIANEEIQIKSLPSKPFYIYYEIMKRKYPNYMNWKLFPIPQDSLK
ncbi:hypothetical protein [Elizabethkingia ursingii]|uniref:hypothetical protein n=1 Tax=Elizabethkingia ursingii TaxID=1756150 RepID=UPI002011182C|nr:hypothetical protein [Elizabethkingia ursingii]MCL1671474.1 hypothetical protein [Elizabethkingia ursingii]